jgi:hypothetical protein
MTPMITLSSLTRVRTILHGEMKILLLWSPSHSSERYAKAKSSLTVSYTELARVGQYPTHRVRCLHFQTYPP